MRGEDADRFSINLQFQPTIPAGAVHLAGCLAGSPKLDGASDRLAEGGLPRDREALIQKGANFTASSFVWKGPTPSSLDGTDRLTDPRGSIL